MRKKKNKCDRSKMAEGTIGHLKYGYSCCCWSNYRLFFLRPQTRLCCSLRKVLLGETVSPSFSFFFFNSVLSSSNLVANPNEKPSQPCYLTYAMDREYEQPGSFKESRNYKEIHT